MNIDYSKITDNPEVIKLLKQRIELENKIKSLDEMALINYELELLSLPAVSQRSELLKALVEKEVDVNLLSGHKGRILAYEPETFLVKYNHNDHTDWLQASEINHKSF